MVAAEQAGVQTAGRRVLDELLQGRGLAPNAYALFFVVGEGTFFELPQTNEAVETMSGSVLDERGRIFSFWMEWDVQLGQPILSEWEEVEPEPHWTTSPEYQRARHRLGLPAA